MYVYCDKLRVKEILVNLLGNAVKYTQTSGKLSLRIIQQPCEQEGYGNYEIHVKDNGCGMSQEFLQKIFVPFGRQANSTISGIQGTGLGMTIIKGLVNAMGGTIEIASEKEKRTEITVRIRCRLAQVPQEQEEQDTTAYPSELFAGKRIPVMDGYTATRQIRAVNSRYLSRIPVIAVSANAFDEDMEASYEAGMNGHLAKPIIVSELLKTLGDIWFPTERNS